MASTKPTQAAKVTVLPFVVRTITPGGESQTLNCPECESPLNLIQPDEGDPCRLLGTCESCSAWGVLIELEQDWQKALLIEVPGGDELFRSYEQAEATRGREG